MKDIVEKIKQLEYEHEQAVLATIVGVEGSAYRKAGAKMIFTRSGRQFGTISAGCLETDLALKMDTILESGKSDILTYDMRSEADLAWGLGSGCNGKIDILVEPLSWIPPLHDSGIWLQIDDWLKQGHHIAVAKSVGGAYPVSSMLLKMDNGQLIGTLGDAQADQVLKEKLGSFLSGQEKRKTEFIDALKTTFFFDKYEPKQKLFVFGAGPDAEPLVRHASKINFEVTVFDHRESRNTEQFFPDADHRIVAHPERALEQIQIGANDYVIIMTHSFEKDQILLSKLVDLPLTYLGVLGPGKRTRKLLQLEELPHWIHSPIGLDIGADGPEEIAFSIIAELLAVKYEKGGKKRKGMKND